MGLSCKTQAWTDVSGFKRHLRGSARTVVYSTCMQRVANTKIVIWQCNNKLNRAWTMMGKEQADDRRPAHASFRNFIHLGPAGLFRHS